MPASERVPVLMSPAEKKILVSKAKKAGMKTSEFMRLAAHNYVPGEDEKAIVSMIDEMNKATANASKSIDRALFFVAQSNERIEKMETEARK